jgi:hypothetical protein
MNNMKKLLLLLLPIMLVISAVSVAAQHSVTVNITWVPSGDPPLAFLIQRSNVSGGPYTTICGGGGQPVCPAGAPTAVYVDSTVTGGQTYYYVARAYNTGGLGPLSAEAKSQIPFLPPTTTPSLSTSTQ